MKWGNGNGNGCCTSPYCPAVDRRQLALPLPLPLPAAAAFPFPHFPFRLALSSFYLLSICFALVFRFVSVPYFAGFICVFALLLYG